MAWRGTSACACRGARYFWVNPFGKLFSEVTAENLVLVNHKGEIIDGWPMINQAGFCIHSAIHQARPDVDPRRAYASAGRQRDTR